MEEKKRFADEIFEQRVAFYKENRRTKLPWQSTKESCQRVSGQLRADSLNLSFPEDFLTSPEDLVDGSLCPPDLFRASIEVDAATGTARLIGSGGMVVLDRSHCVIDVVGYLLAFIQPESCGECTLCRVGTPRLSRIIERISNGQGKLEDIDDLEELASSMEIACMCEIGKMAASPVLATLRYFRDDYIAHIEERYCRAGKCVNLTAAR